MTGLVAYMLLFVGIAIFFVFFHLVLGKFVRPVKPDAEKLTIYECGEPTIGSSWIQFDLRFYVVALLFVIFDVEVAFFFPWAVVFGNATSLASPALSSEQRIQRTAVLSEEAAAKLSGLYAKRAETESAPNAESQILAIENELKATRSVARDLAWFALWDILIFFGVLLVGYLYLWRRGDLDWVRSVASERVAEATYPQPGVAETGALVAAGRE